MNPRLLLSTLLALAACCAALGCHDECAAGYALENHLCFAPQGGAEAGAPGGGGAAGRGAGEEAGASGCEPTFGAECLTSAECSCDATFCAGYPGEVGVCTRTGCVEDSSVCPSDWGCMDLAAFGLPSICTPPP